MTRTDDAEHPDNNSEAETAQPPAKPPVIHPNDQSVLGEAERRPRKKHKETAETALLQTTRMVEWMQLCTNAALAVIGTVALLIYGYQWKAMEQTVDEMQIQNRAQERAVLTINNPLIPLQGGEMAAQIKNVGRMPATIESYSVSLIQIAGDGSAIGRNRTSKWKSVVSIENPYMIIVRVPKMPVHVLGHAWGARLSINIKYDDGFGDTETVSSCFSPSPSDGSWQATCMWGYSVDITRQQLGDTYLPPPKQQHQRQNPN